MTKFQLEHIFKPALLFLIYTGRMFHALVLSALDVRESAVPLWMFPPPQVTVDFLSFLHHTEPSPYNKVLKSR